MRIPDPLERAAAAFDALPGIGPRAALRYAYWLVTQPATQIQQFAAAIQGLVGTVRTCPSCHQWTEGDQCRVCTDATRDGTLLCVVSSSQDAQAIEDTRAFKGRYHVLGGTIDPIEGRTPEKLTIPHLLERIRRATPSITEVILALDTDVQGDTTALYLRKQLVPLGVRVSALARGLPSGAALEYADPHTLADALMNRKP